MQRFATLVCLYIRKVERAFRQTPKHEPMKRVLLFFIFVVCWSGFAFGDEPQNPTPKSYDEQNFWERFTNWSVPNLQTKSEVRLGFPILDYGFVRSLNNNVLGSGLKGDYISASQKVGGMYTYSSPQISYMVRWGKSGRWEHGVSALYSQVRQNLYNTVTSEVAQSLRYNTLTLSPTLRWNIIRWNWLRFYVQMGVNYFIVNRSGMGMFSETEFFFGYGYTVGKKIFFFAEGGGNGDTIINSMGIGYRF